MMAVMLTKKLRLVWIVGCSMLVACSERKDPSVFYMPAEWEEHEAVWLGWEDNVLVYREPIVELIKTLSPFVPLKIAAADDSLRQVAQLFLHERAIDTTRIQFYTMRGERYWIRDHGATFLVNEKGELGVADFDWNHYGYPGWLRRSFDNEDSVKANSPSPTRGTGAVDSLMAVAEGAQIFKTKVIHEGGATEVNGKGTLILCEATVFQRNPDWSKEDLEKEFKRVLGVSKIIWLKKGLADDPHITERITGDYFGVGTGGHTDEFVRFINPNTVLLAWVDESEKDTHPITAINYERMNENLKILEQSTDQDGKPLTVIKFPLPDPIYKSIVIGKKVDYTDTTYTVSPDWFLKSETPLVGDTLLRVAASSYLNYLVTNGVVVMPTYVHMGSSKEKELQAQRILQEAFPGRKVFAIPFMPQNWYGGGIHCSTQQQPNRKK
jgi:agmatine deiminase